jgi:propanol-preferring alcohol dehydrogenase
MSAMVLARPAPIESRPLAVHVEPRLDPAAGELVLVLSACAVCRTDLQICEGDLPAHRLPIVPGHQAVGTVEAIGQEVRGWSVGDRAGVGWLAGTDGTCDACRAGNENLCPNAQFTGYDRDGGYAHQLAVRADFALRLPQGFSDREAAPLLCGGVIGYRSLRVSGIQPGGRLGLFGFGASAHLSLQVARHWGCEVYVVTRSTDDRRRALEIGATWAGGYDEPVPVQLDAAVTFAPVGSSVVAALASLRPGRTVAINAIHLDGIPAFSYDLLWRERGIRSVANYTRQDAREFLALAAEIPIRAEIEVLPLIGANEALARMKSGALHGTAVLDIDGASRDGQRP